MDKNEALQERRSGHEVPKITRQNSAGEVEPLALEVTRLTSQEAQQALNVDVRHMKL